MKLGIIISIALVLAIGAALFFGLRGVADLPTSATRPEKLKKTTLPESLPRIWEPADMSANANERYNEAIEYVLANVKDPAKVSDRVADKLTDQVIGAMDAGQLNEPFLDDRIPLKLGADPDFRNALELIPQVVLTRAEKVGEQGDKQRAIRAGRAIFALGQRAFEHSTRVYPRLVGVDMMIGAGSLIHEMTDDEQQIKDLQAWAQVLLQIKSEWRENKLSIVKNVKPHIGDLINIARNDKDETFRLEAVLQLGSVKFAPGSRGNKRAIADAIEAAKADANPMIAEAGKAAEAFTVEERRRLR